MTKKLLLTTALVSALSAATTANATDFEITYSGNNTYAFEGVNYASFTALSRELGNRLVARTINLNNDTIEITENTQKAFFADLVINKNNVRDQFSQLIAYVTRQQNEAEVR